MKTTNKGGHSRRANRVQPEPVNGRVDQDRQTQAVGFDDFLLGDGNDDLPAVEGEDTRASQTHRASQVLAETVLDAALQPDAARRLRATTGWVLICRVPHASWVPNIARVFETAWPEATTLRKVSKPRKSDDADAEAAELIARGRPIIVVTSSLEHVSSIMLRAADLNLQAPRLSPKIVGRAIRRWCGSRINVRIDGAAVAKLDFLDVVAAMRPDSAPRTCVERLQRAAAATPSGGTPAQRLDDLHGYGAAMDWAASAVATIAQARDSGEPPVLENALLAGPPGTGKTTLARAIARSAEVPIHVTSVAQWFQGSGYLDAVVREGAQFFDTLENGEFCVGVIEEFDALPSRTNQGKNADYWATVIAGILLRLEKLRFSNPRCLLLATTNHAERIDPAICRPGRLDRTIEVGLPNSVGRRAILASYVGKVLSDDELDNVAELTEGATGAVLEGHVRAAQQQAALSGRALRAADVLGQVLPPDTRSQAELRATALHEAAHSIVAFRLGLEVRRVSILQEGNAAGHTRISVPPSGATRAAIEAHVVVSLAGRAADRRFGSGADWGAASDLAAATELLVGVHARWGLGDTLVTLVGSGETHDALRTDVDLRAKVNNDLNRLQDVAQRLVEANRGAILALAAELQTKRLIVASGIRAIAERHCPQWGHSASKPGGEP